MPVMHEYHVLTILYCTVFRLIRAPGLRGQVIGKGPICSGFVQSHRWPNELPEKGELYRRLGNGYGELVEFKTLLGYKQMGEEGLSSRLEEEKQSVERG